MHQRKKSVGGLEGFSPSEFSILSDLTYQWLARMLNRIEAGAPWPTPLLHAKAVFLSKDVNKLEDPMAYRVLLILPTVYRR